ncbi:MAG: 4-alpha-glucanotransferase [Oscillospiraceae bacterium]
MKREAGILLPVFCLPSEYGIGCFSQSAYDFVDFLSRAGQSLWQILPLNPTGYGDSPYQSFSVYAGNPYFIDLAPLIAAGLLTEKECSALRSPSDKVDYAAQYSHRLPLLKKAFCRSGFAQSAELVRFSGEHPWLSGYALFMAVKDSFSGAPWWQWEEDIRLRRPKAVEEYSARLSEDIAFHKFMQYCFFSQWEQLHRYAASRGISIIGDIPIYAALDSADVWQQPELFQLDEKLAPTAVAGCPPDGFSAQGQLWGNPLYRWEAHRREGFCWWISRISHCFRMYDILRIDHFRGFDEYYSIPFGDKNAVNGHWEKGPGAELFTAVRQAIGEKRIIAEDLGYVTDSVRQLVRDCGFSGMKVLQFAFDSRDTGSSSDYLPHNYPDNCACYTGTHDNATLAAWLGEISEEEMTLARAYLCDRFTPVERLNMPLISLLMRSRAEMCIIPIQDYMGLREGRINTPSTSGANWQWRLKSSDLSEELCRKIRDTAALYGRRRLTKK